MSKERAKAREAREAARVEALRLAEEKRAREAKRLARKGKLVIPKRRRRYGALTNRELAELAGIFLAVEAFAWVLTDSLKARVGIGILTLAILGVVAGTRTSKNRRSTTR